MIDLSKELCEQNINNVKKKVMVVTYNSKSIAFTLIILKFNYFNNFDYNLIKYLNNFLLGKCKYCF